VVAAATTARSREAAAMGLLEWLLVAAGVLLAVLVWGVFALRRTADAAAPPAGAQVRRVRVNEGYDPPEVHVEAHRPIRLLFRREETAPCSERVVFPDYGISVGLPAFHEVAVDLPPSEPGAHRFSCEMDMLHGNLIVEANGAPAAARAHEGVPA
jgi:plastocyanin domain-containing protein